MSKIKERWSEVERRIGLKEEEDQEIHRGGGREEKGAKKEI